MGARLVLFYRKDLEVGGKGFDGEGQGEGEGGLTGRGKGGASDGGFSGGLSRFIIIKRGVLCHKSVAASPGSALFNASMAAAESSAC
jgi:hypothetical protein